MRPSMIPAIASIILMLSTAAARNVPYGHPDFFPSPDRPLGWRGDGTGAWLGARTVTNWDAKTGQNIAWKVNTPGGGLCQPVVAGEKVFITADPNLLLCYNAHNGNLLWQTAVDHTLAMPEAERRQARAEQAFFDDHWRAYAGWRCEVTDWEYACAEALGIKVSAIDGGKRNKKDWTVWMGHQGGQARLPRESEPEHQRALKALKDHPQLLQQYHRLRHQCEQNGWTKGHGNSPLIHHWPLNKRYRKAQERWDIWCPLADNWLGFTTYSFATPVTDGRYVYVTTANNAVAAVDYDGRIAWLIWEHLPNQTGVLHTRYVPSPVLCDGKLVVKQQGHLRVYDAATGAKRWDVYGPSAVAAGKKPRRRYPRGDPEGPTPLAGTLSTADGDKVGIVIDNGGQIWRLEDGKLLGSTPMIRYGCGVLLADKGLLVGGDRNQVHKLTAPNRDKVETELLWEGEWGDFLKFKSTLVAGDRIIGGLCPRREKGRRLKTPVYNLRDGSVTWPFGGRLSHHYISKIADGQTLYAFHAERRKGHDHNLYRNYGGGFICRVAPLRGGRVRTIKNALVDRRFAEDSDWAVLNKTHCSGYQQNATPGIQANRIFYRTRGMLWCIGNPQQPFPVPRNCPSHARVK